MALLDPCGLAMQDYKLQYGLQYMPLYPWFDMSNVDNAATDAYDYVAT